MSSTNDGEWTSIGKKGKAKRAKHNSGQFGMDSQKYRPHDSVNNTEDPDDDSGDEHEKVEKLENPLFWNKFALIGDVTAKVHEILMKYQIFPSSPVMSLFDCLRRADKFISYRELETNFDNAVGNLNFQAIFVSVLPRFTERQYGCGPPLYFIHIRFDRYLMADSTHRTYEKGFLNGFGVYLGWIGETHTHIPISDDSEDVKKNFYNVMRILKDKRKYEKFQPDYAPEFVEYLTIESNKKPNPKIIPYYLPVLQENENSKKKVIHKCKLYLEDAHSGYGEILEGKEKGTKIFLHNRKNCSKAFNGDIVDIEIFDESRNLGGKHEETNKQYTGRVISVISSDVRPINKIFLCRVISGSTNLMGPICKTIPVIYVDNKDAEERVKKNYDNLKKGLKDVIGINNIIQDTVKPQFVKHFANKSFVTVKNLEKNLETTFKNIYYIDCYSCDFIFLILYRQWEDSHRFPFGEVVGLYTPDVTFGKTLDLIKVLCDIPPIGIDEEEPLLREIQKIKRINMTIASKKSEKNRTEIRKTYFSLRHPNKPYNETAFSFEERIDKTFVIGVHFVNLADLINEDDYLDKSARNRFFTLLLPIIGKKDKGHVEPDFLLSTAVTKFLSINKDTEVRVISIYFTVDDNNTLIESSLSLDESIILDEEIDVNATDSLVLRNSLSYKFFNKIYHFCKSERCKRLKHIIPTYCFYPNYQLKINETAFIVEEELKYLANREANIMYTYVNRVEESQLNDWRSKVAEHCNTKYSPIISSKMRQLDKGFQNRKGTHLRLSKQFLEQIISHPEVNIFRCESLFPDIGLYHNNWKLLTGTNMTDSDTIEYFPDISITFSITNPLSSYLDIYSQRFLQKIIEENEEIEGKEHIYTEFKNMEISFEKYWTICKGYEIRHQFKDASFILDCVYETFSEEKVFFHHPFLQSVNHHNFIGFRSLNLNKVPIEKSGKDNISLKFTWKTRIFSCDSKITQFKNYDPIKLKDIYSFQTEIWRYPIISSKLDHEDIGKINALLEDDTKYLNKLTSEIIMNIDPLITFEYPIEDRQLMRIQFNYEYSSGIMKLIPELLIVNPDFRICLGHRNDPFKYFLHPQELSNINYMRFLKIKEYKSQFIILNRIEGINQTIITDLSFIIHDLKIDWLAMKDEFGDEDIYGIVILEETWCRERFLRLVHDKTRIHDPVNALHEAVDKNKMDYLLCLQSFIEEKQVYWVGHCRLADICLLDDENSDKKKRHITNYKIHLTLKLVHSSFPIKHSEKQMYSAEFLETPISTRIFERSLRRIRDGTFPAEIVMGNCAKHFTNKCEQVNFKTLKTDMVNDCKLNEMQIKALEKSVLYKFSLIWGPPGTGKTMIGCMIAYWYTIINRNSQPSSILYCGPSNQSVDVVAEKLMKTFESKCPKLLRIFNKEVMNFDFPYAGARIKPGLSGCPPLLRDIALHYIIRKPGKPHCSQLQKLETELRENRRRDQMERFNFAEILKSYEKLLKKAFLEEIKDGNYEIVLTTAASSCKQLLDSLTITQIILDECGMCSEPEAIGPFLNRNDVEHVVLIGDHKQLRPIVTCQVAKGKQFDTSLFERLYKPKKGYCTMLDTQYRMHPSICEFPSEQFYKDQSVILKTARCESWTGIPDHKVVDNFSFNGLQYVGLYPNYQIDLKNNNICIADDIWKYECKEGRKSNFKCYLKNIDFSGPQVLEKIKFIHAMGTEINQEISCSTGSSQSKGNDYEVQIVAHIYEKLIKRMQTNASQSILVITQYRLQESFLKQTCEKILKKYDIQGSPRVSTVVKSQGSESDYVIFSTVRSLPNLQDIDRNPSPGWISKYLGFITDQNQFNVALTRAKKGLFIIGNSHLLSVDETWKALINDLKNRRCYIDDILRIF